MLYYQTTPRWILLPLLSACLLLGQSGQTQDKPIPSDFRIVAEYGCGYSDWVSWKCTITGDGKVAQEIYDLEDAKRSSKLAVADLRDLLRKIREADFFALKKRYDFSVTDNPTLVLSITLGGKIHDALVYAPDHQKKNKEVRRFFRVWSEILRKVPSPNAEDKPEHYRP
jgi:hypothetical protein